MRARSRSTGRPIGRWWSTPARRTNGGSSGWHVTSRPRIAPLQTAARTAEQQEYFCRADAEAAAAKLRAVPTAYHLVDVTVEERPVYGRGRPSSHKPRPVKAMRYRLKTTIRPHTERIARREEEAGCFVLLTNVPTAGDLAHSARDILTVYKEQHGTEQNYGFLKDPVIVNSLFLKKPERIEALGLVLLLALLHLALDGTGHADVCRHHQHALDGVGQESDGAADRLHDGHEVRWA